MEKPTRAPMRRRRTRRKKPPLRLLAVGAPLLALLLLTGWQATFAPADSGNAAPPAQSDGVDTTSPSAAGTDAPPLSDAQASENRGSADDWNLLLVNPWNSVPEGYEITLTQLKNGHAVDERCYPALQKMMDDCRAAGLSPLICSSYRTQEKQERLYNNRVNSLVAKGYSQADAKTEAGKAVAVPGTSEHQLGLAVDIVDVNNQNLDFSQEKTAVQQWLMAHSWEYGFVLRYPSDKSDVTGIQYEPWHYRYVGTEAAQYMFENGICFEEYVKLLA